MDRGDDDAFGTNVDRSLLGTRRRGLGIADEDHVAVFEFRRRRYHDHVDVDGGAALRGAWTSSAVSRSGAESRVVVSVRVFERLKSPRARALGSMSASSATVEPRLTLNTSGESSASFHVITMTPSSTSTLGFFVEFGFRRATSASSFAASSVWKMPRPGLASAVLAAMRMPSDGASTSPERHDASRAASFYAWRRRVDVFESPPPRRTSYRARFPPFRRWIRR